MTVYVWYLDDHKVLRRKTIETDDNDHRHDLYEKVAYAFGRSFVSIVNPLWWLSKNNIKYITKDKDYDFNA